MVGAKIKDQQGLMKDRVREREKERWYSKYFVRFRLKKANEKMTKCAPNAPNGAHLCAKSGEFVRRSGEFYYINVRQIGGHKKVRQWGISGGKS